MMGQHWNNQTKGKTESTGDCANAVKGRLHAGGLDVSSLHNSPQNYGAGLEKLGLMPIDNNSPPKSGDVMVFQPPGNRKNGHIQMWNGNNRVSDYMQPNQPDGYPGPGAYYRKTNPSYQFIGIPTLVPKVDRWR
jgi:hypothetical protein